jgi:cellulose synthase/poly-beta-1,6-N-acetylglucosamine synthase-like glycosyltransferase
VIVIADGDPDTASAARSAGAIVVDPPERLGKAQAINQGVAATTAEILILTDANNALVSGSIEAAVRWFGDPAVGAVAGEKVEDAESLYWRFESFLKRREATLGTTIGLVGEFAAVRAAAWRPIPADISSDDLWTALDLCERGHLIAYEPAARAMEAATGLTMRQAWERRTRIVAGGLHVLVRKRSLLHPAAGLVAAELWGHRMWRYTMSPLAHVALLAASVRSARRSPAAAAFVAVHIVAAAGLWRRSSGKSVGGLGGALSDVLFLQAVGIGGIIRYARGDRVLTWPTVSR